MAKQNPLEVIGNILRQGVKPEEILQELIKQGVPEQDAIELITASTKNANSSEVNMAQYEQQLPEKQFGGGNVGGADMGVPPSAVSNLMNSDAIGADAGNIGDADTLAAPTLGNTGVNTKTPGSDITMGNNITGNNDANSIDNFQKSAMSPVANMGSGQTSAPTDRTASGDVAQSKHDVAMASQFQGFNPTQQDIESAKAGEFSEFRPQNPNDSNIERRKGKVGPQAESTSIIAGLAAYNEYLEGKRYDEWESGRNFNTMTEFSESNPQNPFGNYTPNAGPASNFQLITNTPPQNLGQGFFQDGGENPFAGSVVKGEIASAPKFRMRRSDEEPFDSNILFTDEMSSSRRFNYIDKNGNETWTWITANLNDAGNKAYANAKTDAERNAITSNPDYIKAISAPNFNEQGDKAQTLYSDDPNFGFDGDYIPTAKDSIIKYAGDNVNYQDGGEPKKAMVPIGRGQRNMDYDKYPFPIEFEQFITDASTTGVENFIEPISPSIEDLDRSIFRDNKYRKFGNNNPPRRVKPSSQYMIDSRQFEDGGEYKEGDDIIVDKATMDKIIQMGGEIEIIEDYTKRY